MYIHLGRDYVLNDRDIIGIFEVQIHRENSKKNHDT